MTPARILPALALLTTASLAACGDDPVSPRPGDVPAVIAPAAQWSAGTVTVEWPWLEGRDELPRFLAGDSVAEAERTGPGSVRLRLPRVGAGALPIVAEIDSRWDPGAPAERVPLGQVAVAGFVDVIPAPALWTDWNYTWPDPAATRVIGIGAETRSVILVDLETGASSPKPIPGRNWLDLSLRATIGWTATPGQVVVPDPQGDVIQVWDVSGDPVLLGEATIQHWTKWQVHSPAPGRLLQADDDDLMLSVWSEENARWEPVWSERVRPQELLRSPAGDRIAVLSRLPGWWGGADKHFVLEGDASEPAFFLPAAIARIQAGAFSPGGESLILAVDVPEVPRNRLVRFSAATGAQQAEAGFTPHWEELGPPMPVDLGGHTSALAVTGGRVYLAFNDWADTSRTTKLVRIRVYSAADLQLEAEFELPVEAGLLHEDTIMAVTADRSRALLYAPRYGKIWRVALLPE